MFCIHFQGLLKNVNFSYLPHPPLPKKKVLGYLILNFDLVKQKKSPPGLYRVIEYKFKESEAEFKEFEPWLKFKTTRLKYGWFHPLKMVFNVLRFKRVLN